MGEKQERHNGLERLETAIGYCFKDARYLTEALTHTSSLNEAVGRGTADNQRLEFLGDAVLSFLVSAKLVELFPESREGELSRIRSAFVDEEHLSLLASRLELGRFLILGRGEERTGGRGKKSILADAFEAIIGAVYLDGGIEAAATVVNRLFLSLSDAGLALNIRRDYKSEFQEFSQANLGGAPRYVVRDTVGPDHDREFTVDAIVADEVVGSGSGKSKKEAEQQAAREALEKLRSGSNRE